MTYEDFISEVKKYLNSSQVAFSKTGPNNINSNFSANDIEVGKIYMVWRTKYASLEDESRQVWFVCPYESILIGWEEGFKFYWCEGEPRGFKKGVIYSVNSRNDIWKRNRKWQNWAWAGGDWVEILTPQKFINWNEFPWSDK